MIIVDYSQPTESFLTIERTGIYVDQILIDLNHCTHMIMESGEMRITIPDTQNPLVRIQLAGMNVDTDGQWLRIRPMDGKSIAIEHCLQIGDDKP